MSIKTLGLLFACLSTICLSAVELPAGQASAGSQPSPTVKVVLESDGIAISAGEIGKLKMTYPCLTTDGKVLDKPTEASVDKDSADLKYANGAALKIALLKGRNLQFHYTSLPAKCKMRMDMDVPLLMKDGKFAVDGGELKPFPAEKGEQFVFRGNFRNSRLVGPGGTTLDISMEHGWQQLQDHRVWNGEKFDWLMATDMKEGEFWFTMSIGDGTNLPAGSNSHASGNAKTPPPQNVKAGFSLCDKGVAIDAGGLGHFTMEYPTLRGDGEKVSKCIEKNISGGTARLKYENGGQAELTLAADGAVKLNLTSVPSGVKQFRVDMLVDFNFSQGGTWKVSGGDEKPFPAEKPSKPHLYQGNVEQVTFKDCQGRTISFRVPPYSFQQLTDNREWGWKTFYWFSATPILDNVSTYTFKISIGGAGEAKVLVDKFGQSASAEYPGKVRSVEELKNDVAAEKQWLDSLAPPERDEFGGLIGSGEKLGLHKTGFFHVEKKDNKWFLADPAGNAFFHMGLCGFCPSDDYTYFKGRESIYEWLPSHGGEYDSAFHSNTYWRPNVVSFHLINRIRKYGKPYEPGEYTAEMIRRVRKWGFNSAGAFGSGEASARKQASFPAVAHLPLAQWEGISEIPGATGSWDPFDPKNRQRVDKLFSERVAPAAEDPLIIGYFLANEPLYEDLPKVLPTLNGKFACKRRLVQMLEEKYKSIDAFNRAWNMQAGTFEELADRGLAVTTRAASQDVADFTGVFLEEYFKLVSETFRKYDKNHMLIGNRLQSGTINNEQLCRISGKYMDVISFNYYTYHLDKDFLRRIYSWTGGKPMFLSEYYYNSPKDSGLPGGGKDVSSQAERGLGYRNYVEQAASLGFIAGIEWFTLVDQSVTGRWFSKYNGENGNTGLIAVTDRPWKAMLDHMMKTNYEIYDVLLGVRPPFEFDDPRFRQSGSGTRTVKIARATGEIRMNGLAENWPGTPAEQITSKRLVQGASAAGLECSFKLCWDDKNLYLLANITDGTPMLNEHKGDMLWNGDAIELFVGHEKIGEGGGLMFTDRQALLGAGKPGGQFQWFLCHSPKQYECRMHLAANADGKGYTLEAAIPFEALGFEPKENMEFLFDIGVDDSENGKSRTRQIMWNGTDRNSGDRSHWGRAVLAK